MPPLIMTPKKAKYVDQANVYFFKSTAIYTMIQKIGDSKK